MSELTRGEVQSAANPDRRRVVVALVACGVPSLVVLLWIYAPILVTDFLYRDDYAFMTRPRGLTLTRIALSQARPLQGLFVDLMNTGVIVGSGAKRSFGVLGLAMLGTAASVWFRRQGLSWAGGLALALLVCCTPSLQATAAYLTLTASIYGALASALAVLVFFRSTASESGLWPPWRLSLVAGGLLVVALSCYQPAAMFCCSLLIAPLYSTPEEEWPRLRGRLLCFFACLGCSLLAYATFFRILIGWLQLPVSGRSEIVSLAQVPEKVAWFAGELVPSAWRSSWLLPNEWHGLTAATTAALSWLIPLSAFLGPLVAARAWRDRRAFAAGLERLAFLAALLLGSYLPFLLLRENGSDIVHLVALQATLVIAGVLGARSLLPSATDGRLRLGFDATLAIGLLLLAAPTTRRHVDLGYVLPNHREYALVRAELAQRPLAEISRIHVVGGLNFSSVLSYSEFLVRAVLNELAGGVGAIRISSSAPMAPPIAHRHILVQHPFAAEYYELDPAQGYYVLRPLSAEDRTVLDRRFAEVAEGLAAEPGVVMFDLARERARMD